MHIFTSQGIVLNKLRYLESDLIVTIFSKDEGKLKAIVKGGASSRKRFPGAFEAGNTGEFGFVDKNPYQLMHISHATVDNYFINLKKDYDKILMLFYLLGITDVMLPEHQSHTQLFDILLYTLYCLESGMGPGINNFLNQIRLFYELHLLKEIGLLRAVEKCESCGRPFSNDEVNLVIKTGKLICKSCITSNTEAYRIPASLLRLIKTINSNDIDINRFLTVDIPSVIFSFTMRIMSAYIDRPLKLWDMIDKLLIQKIIY